MQGSFSKSFKRFSNDSCDDSTQRLTSKFSFVVSFENFLRYCQWKTDHLHYILMRYGLDDVNSTEHNNTK